MSKKLLTKYKDRLEGERIYAEFREYQPKKLGYVEDKETGRRKTTLLKTVHCTIEKPVRRK